jgi:hypothetical protein
VLLLLLLLLLQQLMMMMMLPMNGVSHKQRLRLAAVACSRAVGVAQVWVRQTCRGVTVMPWGVTRRAWRASSTRLRTLQA